MGKRGVRNNPPAMLLAAALEAAKANERALTLNEQASQHGQPSLGCITPPRRTAAAPQPEPMPSGGAELAAAKVRGTWDDGEGVIACPRT